MRLPLPVIVRHVPRIHVLAAFLLVTWLSYASTPPVNSLHTPLFSSVLLWTYGLVRTGHGFQKQATTRQIKCWAAAALFALGQLCQRAAGDVDALWWSSSLLPGVVLLTYLVQANSDNNTNTSATSKSRQRSTSVGLDGAQHRGSSQRGSSFGEKRLLLIASAATLIVLANPYTAATNTALGISSTAAVASAYILLEEAVGISTKIEDRDGSFVSANGSLLRRNSWSNTDVDSVALCIRDSAFSLAVCTLVTGIVLGVFRWNTFATVVDWHHLNLHSALRFFILSGIGIGKLLLTVLAVKQYGSYDTSLVHLTATVLAQMQNKLNLEMTLFGLVSLLPTLCASSELLVQVFGPASRHALQPRRIVMLIGVLFITSSLFRNMLPDTRSSLREEDMNLETDATLSSAPLEYASSGVHPIKYLTDRSKLHFQALQARQSRTLSEAVAEYTRRYHFPPPPHFDKWFELAVKYEVKLIDEFDTIYDALLPFWALKPATIRARVTEALGFENNGLIALFIRDGRVVSIHGGPDWQRSATVGMIKEFVHLLPDMDIAFNVHDEPRVVLPHDDLTRMVDVAINDAIPAIGADGKLRNDFSKRPKDLGSGKAIKESKVTRFNEYAHQNTWGPARLSCSPDSPSRAFEDDVADNITAYALGELGFIYNQTAFSDICNSPSLRRNYGFFDRPNAFKISHELIPIFSQSKISSFQDILYPSPWYWSGTVSTDDLAISHQAAQVEYSKGKDMPWSLKEDNFWWRGSTTGGFSRAGGWRRQHRQTFVKHINGLDKVEIMVNTGSATIPNWQVTDVSRQNYSSMIDVKFSGVGQCDPGDCDAQKEFFTIAPGVDMQQAWRHKYLLDIDGNAFSGRFYAFLHSASLVYKMAVFREWHGEWLMPWVHYIPLSLKGEEHVESVRYFAEEAEGKKLAPELARESQEWAGRVLRSADLEVWMFRLLLEYARVVDDERSSIGFTVT